MQTVETNIEREKKPYEAPVLRVVRLEVTASVLSTCLSSAGVSPSGGTCAIKYQACYLPTPVPSVR
jgi:hypothetical protein